MKLISDAFERRHQRSLESAVKSALSGSEEMAVLALLSDPIDFYCKTLKVVSACNLITTRTIHLNYCILLSCLGLLVLSILYPQDAMVGMGTNEATINR